MTQVNTWRTAGPPSIYNVRGDIDLDGDVDAADESTINGNFNGITLGRGNLSANGVANWVGYSGLRLTVVAAGYAIRFRNLSTNLGMWTRRDPLPYQDGANLYSYVLCNPTISVDPFGLEAFVGQIGNTNMAIQCNINQMPCNIELSGCHGRSYKKIFGKRLPTSVGGHWGPLTAGFGITDVQCHLDKTQVPCPDHEGCASNRVCVRITATVTCTYTLMAGVISGQGSTTFTNPAGEPFRSSRCCCHASVDDSDGPACDVDEKIGGGRVDPPPPEGWFDL